MVLDKRAEASQTSSACYLRGELDIMTFTIGEAWTQAMEFFRRNQQILLILMGGSAIAIGIVQLIMIGGDMQSYMQQVIAAAQSGNPEQLAALGGGGLATVSLLAAIVQGTARQATLRMGLGGGDSMSDALVYGVKAALMLFLMGLVIGIVFAVVAVILITVLGVGAVAAGSGSGSIGLGILIGLALLVGILWLFARFCLTGAAMADAATINPLFGLRQSWQLTAPHQWSILGYLVLLYIAIAVVSLLAQSIFGIFGGFIGGILSLALVQAPVAIAWTSVIAGIYIALTPRKADDVFA